MRQYAANGRSVLFSKYFVRNLTEKNAPVPEAIAPTIMGPVWLARFAVTRSGSLRTAAANITGVASKKEKRAEFS